MSEILLSVDGVAVTLLWGGNERGRLVQVDVGDFLVGIQLSRHQAALVAPVLQRFADGVEAFVGGVGPESPVEHVRNALQILEQVPATAAIVDARRLLYKSLGVQV